MSTNFGGPAKGVRVGPPSIGDIKSNWMGVSRLMPSTGVVVVEGTREALSLHEIKRKTKLQASLCASYHRSCKQ